MKYIYTFNEHTRQIVKRKVIQPESHHSVQVDTPMDNDGGFIMINHWANNYDLEELIGVVWEREQKRLDLCRKTYVEQGNLVAGLSDWAIQQRKALS